MLSHGWIFVALQFLIVIGLVPADSWLRRRLRTRRAPVDVRVPLLLTTTLFLVYLSLRVQPYLRSGTIYTFSLGVFDGITVMGLVLPWILHRERMGSATADPSTR